jgi:hypothetical protein
MGWFSLAGFYQTRVRRCRWNDERLANQLYPPETLRCATLFLYDFGQVTCCLISHTYRRFRHPSAALEKAFKIVAKQIALRSNQLLRASATHHVVYFLEIAVHALSTQTAQFARDPLKSVRISPAGLHNCIDIAR